jgi:flagellar protein FlgJ
MAIESVNASFYADPAGLDGLKRQAATQSPEALRQAAREFESLFTSMMLKSMRSASGDDPLFGSDQADMYQDMFDQQMATQLSRGKGLGLADMLVRQLMQRGGADAPAVQGSDAKGGRMQQVGAGFRAYASPAQSIGDYVRLLKGNVRYASALGTGSDVAAFARGLSDGGYATDPAYVAKLTAVAASLKGGNSLPIQHTSAS